jgi:hypothetical protein
MSARRQMAVRGASALVLRALALGAFALGPLAGSGCGGDERTGLHVIARVSKLDYDELRFGVTTLDAPGPSDAGDLVLVDPATRGRYVAPFAPGDQDVDIYVSDALDGAPVRCDVEALRAAAVIAEGSAVVTVARHAIKDVEVLLLGPGIDGDAGSSPGSGGGPGSAGAGGSAGATGAAGMKGDGDNGPGGPAKDACAGAKKAMCRDGQSCVDGGCL